MQVNKSFFILLLIIFPVIAYWNSFDVPFQFDDHHVIRDNPGIRDLSNLEKVFKSFPHRPVAQLTFALNYHFHELDVWGYHLVNLVIHIINALLVFWLVLQILHRLKEKNSIQLKDSEILFIAFSTGLLFAVHPVQTQAVTYIVQRMASLATLFYLLAVNCFLQGRRVLSKRKFAWIWFVLSGLSGLLGLFTKQIVFTFPIMILMLEWILYDDIGLFLKKYKKKAILIGIIFLLFLLILPLVYKLDFSGIFKTIPPEQGHTYTLTPYNYFLTQLRVHITYLRLIFLPINQHLDYDYPISESLFEWKVILSALFLLALVVLAVRYRKKYPVFSIGILWYFIASAVESSIIPIPNVIFEHRLYLSMMGILLIIIYTIYKSKFNATVIVLIIAVSLMYMTHNRNKIWKCSETLWKNSYYLAANKARTNLNYGNALLKNKEYLEAYFMYTNSKNINNNFKMVHNNLTSLKLNIGDISSSDSLVLNTYKGKLDQIKYYLDRNLIDKAQEVYESIKISDIESQNPYPILIMSKKLKRDDLYDKIYKNTNSANLLTTDEKYRLLLFADTSSFSNLYLDKKNLSEETIAEVFYKMAIKYVNDNNYDKAMEYINEALEYKKDHRFYSLRAFMFYNRGNYNYAIFDLTSAFSFSNNYKYIKLRSKCYQKMGKSETAEYDIKYYEALKEKHEQEQKLW